MALKRNPNGVFNQSLTHAELNDIAMCSDSAKKLLDSFFDQHHTSIRGQTRMIKLSRTVADAQGCDSIELGHAAEAIPTKPAPSTAIFNFSSSDASDMCSFRP